MPCQSIPLHKAQRSWLFAFTLSKSNEFILLIGETRGCIYMSVQSIYALLWLGLHQASEKLWGVTVYILLPFRAVEVLSLLSGSLFDVHSHQWKSGQVINVITMQKVHGDIDNSRVSELIIKRNTHMEKKGTALFRLNYSLVGAVIRAITLTHFI